LLNSISYRPNCVSRPAAILKLESPLNFQSN
jgi:hypothetical protein